MNRANRILKSKDKNLLIPRFTMHRNVTELCFRYTVDRTLYDIEEARSNEPSIFHYSFLSRYLKGCQAPNNMMKMRGTGERPTECNSGKR